ncbi:DNA primase [Arcobacter porcinus]|uniref:DNA primase n=1 Tax=Arcobacter porcinus TaxID=1935204 RepID=A0A5C2HDZ7_9BACT|nr:DNA primase [Arcobacter porcinus]OCL96577.1 DNA primase [Aliarcobacter thereius]QEP41173.1 DNA primase [Arcobacter porcinus]
MIKKESIENLKNNLDIVDVVSQYIELKKNGANYKACCPFHNEATPSFVVSPAKQIYHCFGCGVGGDSIKFVMEYEKYSYPEAIEKLANITNFTLSYETNTSKRTDTKVLEATKELYRKQLLDNSSIIDYLKDRGVYESSIEMFEIGYAGNSISTIEFLKQNHYKLNDAIELGVISQGDNGLYARFIDRVIFPIYSINSKLVGFGGRTLTNHGAKYVNSPQTPIFNKSKLLYGYSLAKEKIYKVKELIVCEGYLDVIMLHQAGFSNAVATLGTALTKEHLPLLRRGEPKITLAYDGDKAGLAAAFKASLMLSQSGFAGGVTVFEDGLDPADMVKDKRVQELSKKLSDTKPFIEFCIDYIVLNYDLNDPLEKKKALDEANEYLNTLDKLLQEEYKRYIAQKLNIKESLIRTQNIRVKRDEKSFIKYDIAELCILKTILEEPKRLDIVLDLVTPSMFEHHQEEFETILNDPTDNSLNKIILNEKLEVYDDERLSKELLPLLHRFYSNKLISLQNNTSLDFKEKVSLIKKTKDNLYELKQGKLIKFNL